MRTRKVVLAWADTRNGIAQHDSVSHALAVIERLGYESGAYDTYIRTDSNVVARQPLTTTGSPASGGPSLANVDAIFFFEFVNKVINKHAVKVGTTKVCVTVGRLNFKYAVT